MTKQLNTDTTPRKRTRPQTSRADVEHAKALAVHDAAHGTRTRFWHTVGFWRGITVFMAGAFIGAITCWFYAHSMIVVVANHPIPREIVKEFSEGKQL